MRWYRTAGDFEDMFKEPPEVTERRRLRQKVSESPVTQPYKLVLYRGLRLNGQIPDSLTLDPSKSEQGLLWFTHAFIRGYNPVEYAKNHGDVLLTYPLDCQRHFLDVKYNDGSTEQAVDRKFADQAEPTENTRFLVSFPYCIELPEGWYFTYKMEKFIGCSIPIVVSRNMMTPVVQENEE